MKEESVIRSGSEQGGADHPCAFFLLEIIFEIGQ